MQKMQVKLFKLIVSLNYGQSLRRAMRNTRQSLVVIITRIYRDYLRYFNVGN